jgi:lipoprotein LprG
VTPSPRRRYPPAVRPTRVLAALAVVATLLLAGCSGSEADLPAGAELLTRSAEAMRQVQSAALDIEVDQALTAIPIRAASGSLTATGDAVGTATLSQGGAPVEFEFLVTGGQLYLKGPTGGFGPPIPVSFASSFYDPTALLDPDRGVAQLLATAMAGETQAREEVDGVDSYRVPASFGPDAVASLVPGVTEPVDGLLWIDAATSRLVRAELQVPNGPDGATAPVAVRLSEFDAPVTVTAPA